MYRVVWSVGAPAVRFLPASASEGSADPGVAALLRTGDCGSRPAGPQRYRGPGPLRNNARWALLLAPDQPAAYGMGRMMQALLDVDGIRCAVFAHASGQEAEAEALAWLLADAPASAPRPS